jgi:hypothetical protein
MDRSHIAVFRIALFDQHHKSFPSIVNGKVCPECGIKNLIRGLWALIQPAMRSGIIRCGLRYQYSVYLLGYRDMKAALLTC